MNTITNMEKQNSTELTDFWQQINGSHLKISYEIAAHPANYNTYILVLYTVANPKV